jgi:hypothetical protein
MLSLLDYCHNGSSYPDRNIWEAAKKTPPNKTTGVTIGALETDFAEILGPLLLAAEDSVKYGKIQGVSWLIFPSAGNEGQYDYLLNGAKYSAKAGSKKSSNVVGLYELVASAGFDQLPDTLEKRLCVAVSKSSSTLYQPIDAVMHLISERVSLPSINADKLKSGYKKNLLASSLIPKDWIEIAANDKIVGKYFHSNTQVKENILAFGKIKSINNNNLFLDKITKPSDLKYSDALAISSKNDYTNLSIRVLGTSAEGVIITAYSGTQKKATIKNADSSLFVGAKIEIYVKNEQAITAKLISGICANEVEELCKGTNPLLDFTNVMSIFAPVFVKVKLGATSASVSVDAKSKKIIRNKNHPTNPRGIVRGKFGIQP